MKNFLKLIVGVFLVSCSSPENETDPTPVQPSTTEYTLTISSGTGGTVSTSGGTYEEGSTVSVIATPNQGYQFVSWSDGNTSISRDLIINSNISLQATFERINVFFSSKSPQYPSINLSSSSVKNNYYHPGQILTNETIYNQISIHENCDCLGCGGCSSRFQLESSIFLDVNNDNKLDLFGFLQDWTGGYAVNWGKYFLVEDVLNEFNIRYFEAESWFGVTFQINDFNGDGRNEVLIFSSDDHADGMGGYFTERTPLKIIYFNDDFSIDINRIGQPTGGGSGTSFDLDQDGDIDIVNFEWWMDENDLSHAEVPLFYINDGTGNFTVQTSNFLESNFYTERNLDYIFTALGSFDINDDGFIDLISGYDNVFEVDYCETNSNGNEVCNVLDFSQDIRIFLGNENGEFSENNQIRIDLTNNSFGTNLLVNGFSFIDFNLDGKFDIVANGSNQSYSGGFIRLFKNIDGQNFEDVTSQLIDVNEWEYVNSSVNTGDIPLLVRTSIVDVDGDGLFDIMPYEINNGTIRDDDGDGQYDWETNIGPNFHWKNIGGSFQLIDDRLDYQN